VTKISLDNHYFSFHKKKKRKPSQGVWGQHITEKQCYWCSTLFSLFFRLKWWEQILVLF